MNYRSIATLTAATTLALISSCASPQASWDQGSQTEVTPQRPKFSKSTYTTAADTLEVETGLAIDPSDSVNTPTTLKYGVNDRAEAFIGLSPVLAVENGGVGFGDLLLGWRQRLTEHQMDHLSIALQGAVKVPTANEDKGLGTGEFDAFGAVMGSLPKEHWMFNGFAQVGLVGDPTGSGTDGQLALAASADHFLDGGASLFGELAGVFTPDENYDAVFTTLGGRWSPIPGLALDTGIVLGLTDDAPSFQFVVGLTRNLGRIGGYSLGKLN